MAPAPAPGAVARRPPAATTGRSKARDAAAIASSWLADDDLRTFLGVHEAGGTTWLRAEPLATLAAWSLALAAADGDDQVAAGNALDRVVGAAAESGYALDGWLARLDGTRGGPAKAPSTKAPPKKAPPAKKAAVKRSRPTRGR